jgi:hypothetical protein
MVKELDPIQYEIFRHRLFNILEEGRITTIVIPPEKVAKVDKYLNVEILI